MSIKNKIVSLFPQKYELPLRYNYKRLMGTLGEELSILPGLIGRGDVVIDIGANYGYFSYALSKIAKKVESFEPNPKCAGVITAYGAENIYVHNVGLSSKDDSLQLHVPIINGVVMTGLASFSAVTGEQQIITVPVKKLDEYHFAGVSFIKIDVEGHETEVLKGAEETIHREKPTLLVEIEQRHLTFPMQDVFDLILSYGYSGFLFSKGELAPLKTFSYERHQKLYVNNPMCPDYINNFIFRPQL